MVVNSCSVGWNARGWLRTNKLGEGEGEPGSVSSIYGHIAVELSESEGTEGT
jgi:hypothetical protein